MLVQISCQSSERGSHAKPPQWVAHAFFVFLFFTPLNMVFASDFFFLSLLLPYITDLEKWIVGAICTWMFLKVQNSVSNASIFLATGSLSIANYVSVAEFGRIHSVKFYPLWFLFLHLASFYFSVIYASMSTWMCGEIVLLLCNVLIRETTKKSQTVIN